jgi:uncharacterized RmlC-like cupin family protein
MGTKPTVTTPRQHETAATPWPDQSWDVVFETETATLVRREIPPATQTPWYTYGERTAYGYVLDGTVRLEYGPDDADALSLGADEFFWVPAGVAHRDVTPGSEPAVVLVALVGSGPTVVESDEAPTTTPSVEPRGAGEDALVPADSLSNLTRSTPFPDAPVQQVRGHASGRVHSEWHTHGDNDVFGYVVAGEGYVAWGDRENERELARGGDFFHVPAGVVHRDVNPSDAEQDYVLWLTGSEPRTVRVSAGDADRNRID